MNRPELDLRQIYAFAMVAEELHFGRAALRLGISQPPLSQQIKRLETFVGHVLLDRDTRAVRLTDAGATLLALAHKLLDDAAIGLAKTRQAGNGEAGILNLGFTATTAIAILPMILGRLRARLPAIHINLIELLPDALAEALASERIDAAIAREMIADQNFECFPLACEPYVAVLPASHRYAKTKTRLKLQNLAAENFVLFPRDRTSRNSDQITDMCREAGFSPRIQQEAPGWQTAVSFVGSGLCVSILPACVRSFMLPQVTYKDIDTTITSTISLMRRAGNPSRLVENFLKIAQTATTPEPA
jgi:DNA-binding transcriptional LysR family regulator